MKIHKSIKKQLNYNSKISDKEIIIDWKKHTSELSKPCWELNYCPYGPVVEDFPILPTTRKNAIDHNNYLKDCIKTGILGSGEKLDPQRKKWFEEQINSFDPKSYPESVPKELLEASCRVFGHMCPAFFVAEPLTETKVRRKHRWFGRF